MVVKSSLTEYPCTERQFNFQKTIKWNLINFTWDSSCISKYFKSTVQFKVTQYQEYVGGGIDKNPIQLL